MVKKLMLLALLIVVLSCGNSSSNQPSVSPPKLVQPQISTAPVRQDAANADKATIFHYICSNECEGSGSKIKGSCPVCGNPLLHNEDYHNRPGTRQESDEDEDAPAQNAFGTWHFTCSNGCEGGAGEPGDCLKCGASLQHNRNYHN